MAERDVSREVSLEGLGDAELADLACRKVDGAFRVIMQRHNRRLDRIARAVLRNDSEAEDVAQEAYVRAFTNLAEFRSEASLATWLSRIAFNEALVRYVLCGRLFDPGSQLAGFSKCPPNS
jgi:RNA polymerase sigma-70 factor (ECF subfamily)